MQFNKKILANTNFIKEDSNFLQKITKLPKLMLSVILLLCLIGLMMMFSSSGGKFEPWAHRQLIHFAISLPIMIIIALIDLKIWFRVSYLAYVGSLLLLLYVELLGHRAMGATRWINLGFIKLQPSELMKISLVFFLARYFHSLSIDELKKVKNLIIPVIAILLPFILILKQPDLGTGIILLLIGSSIFYVVGVKIWKFVVVFVTVGATLPYLWTRLHDYQKQRIFTFLNPEQDPLGSGYNIIQSKIAFGSGGVFGKGFLKGTQSQLNFLPEHQTDFIFTTYCEEWGFVGGLVLLSLYLILIFYSMMIGLNCKNHFGRILALGIGSMIAFHVFINMSMVMGLLPVVGVPLPLLSYGGTMVLTMLSGLGFIMNVHIHKRLSINPGIRSLI